MDKTCVLHRKGKSGKIGTEKLGEDLPMLKEIQEQTNRAVKEPVSYTHLLRKKAVSEWLPTSPYFLADAPEVSVYHWYRKPHQGERYIEIWLPIERRPQ